MPAANDSLERGKNFDLKAFLTLFLILSAALILRCFALGKQSLWWDEFASWTCSQRDFWGALSCDAFQKPPFYYTLLHYWMSAFGSSELTLRSLSIPPSAASVWLVYLFGSRLFSRPIGYLSATYQAVATFQIYFAQEARNYSWLVFFLLLAGLFLWSALEADSPKRRSQYWFAYAASITLALYTHYFAAFFIAGHGLYVLFWRRRHIMPAIVSIGAAFVLIEPFFVLFLRNPYATADQLRHYPFLKLPQAYFAFLFGDSLIPMDNEATHQLIPTLKANMWIIGLILVCAAVLGHFCWIAWSKTREPLLYAAWQGGVPVALAFFVSMKKTFFDRRYMIPASPYVYLLVAVAVFEVILSCRRQSRLRFRTLAGVSATALWCGLLIFSLYQYYFTKRFGKEQWRDAIAYIEESSSPDGKDLLIVDPYKMQDCFRYYKKRDLPVWAMTSEVQEEAVNSEDVIRSHARGFHRLWLVYSHTSDRQLLAALRRIYPEQGSREFDQANGIEIYSFRVAEAK